MKAIRFSILATLVVLMASCQEEIWPNGIVKEGIATSVDFSISVPAAEEISVTKASVAASESEIRELMLIMFEKSNGRKMVLDLTPYMDAGTVSEGYRKYTLTRPIDQDMYLMTTSELFLVNHHVIIFQSIQKRWRGIPPMVFLKIR